MRAPAVTINRGNVGIWVVGAVAVLVVGMLVAGLDLWYQAYYYASTDNAQVTGSFVQVGAPGPAQVVSLNTQVGEYVARGQSVATVQLAPASSAGAAGWVSVHLRAPKPGAVVSLPAREGQLVSAGQPVVVLADPDSLWVEALMDESALKGVRLGQPAEVHVGVLDRTLTGRVAEITPEFSPATQSSGARARPTSLIPVKVELDGDREGLQPGMSAYVKIRIR
jgi:multidrug resistance efflux pump